MTNLPDYITAKEAANSLSMDEWTVRRWCRQGKIPASKPGGSSWRIKREDLKSFAENGQFHEEEYHSPVAQRSKEILDHWNGADHLRTKATVTPKLMAAVDSASSCFSVVEMKASIDLLDKLHEENEEAYLVPWKEGPANFIWNRSSHTEHIEAVLHEYDKLKEEGRDLFKEVRMKIKEAQGRWPNFEEDVKKKIEDMEPEKVRKALNKAIGHFQESPRGQRVYFLSALESVE